MRIGRSIHPLSDAVLWAKLCTQCKRKVLLNASKKNIVRTLTKISTKVKSTIKCKCKVKYCSVK